MGGTRQGMKKAAAKTFQPLNCRMSASRGRTGQHEQDRQ